MIIHLNLETSYIPRFIDTQLNFMHIVPLVVLDIDYVVLHVSTPLIEGLYTCIIQVVCIVICLPACYFDARYLCVVKTGKSTSKANKFEQV